MDRPLAAAAHALSLGDPLRALKYVALRQDAQSLALRATAMAQLGDFAQARSLFKRAAKGFHASHAIARARCTLALAEVALASRELSTVGPELGRAADTLRRHGDLVNASHGELLRARLAMAQGHLQLAEAHLERIDMEGVPSALRASVALGRVEIAQRRMQPHEARAALEVAAQAAEQAGIPALRAEVAAASERLQRPVARLLRATGACCHLDLEQVAALFASQQLVVDACRRCVRQGESQVSFATRPVLFGLVRQLAEAAPREVSRDALIREAFGIKRVSDPLRARLRVAMGRLRKQLAPLAALTATPAGYVLVPHRAPAHVLLPPEADDASSLVALLADGEGWSTSALAIAVGASQRSVQRALGTLKASGRVHSVGRGKGRRWLAAPLQRFAPPLLLPVPSQGG